MDPPPCVQNAMMTKDKKPFTYTPGGIDLSEVRSPRMQRRIERNANLGGVSDTPKAPPPPQNLGPLPPSALAALRPQTQVQVFPSPPPPPPMQKNIPPPPPPPTCPLPTQKVTTNENQVLERPDMTKIIPENPMALLRRTGGPAPRKSFVEQMYEDQSAPPPSPPQRNLETQSPRYPAASPAQQQRAAQAYQTPPQQYQPNISPAVQQQAQRQYQPPTPPQSQYQQQPQFQSQQAQYQPPASPQPQFPERSIDSPKPPGYHPPIIERQATLPRQEQPQRTISSNVGSLYIPPLNQPSQASPQQKVASPPTPPDRQPQIQSPGTPTLKEAPRPWQQKNVQQQQQQQQELPPWARRDEEEGAQSVPAQAAAPNMQQRWQQPVKPAPAQPQPPPQSVRETNQFSSRPSQPQQNQQYSPNSFPVHIEIRSVPYQQNPELEEKKPDAVYITQPIVLQHPGSRAAPPQQQGQSRQQQPVSPNKYQQQQQQPQNNQNYYQQTRQVQQQQQTRVESDGVRIIPIQVEGRTQPVTPGSERNLSRQQSWGNQPPQSNSFKVIQKYTRTDDDEDDETPVTQHSPRYPQEMTEQVRKMKINDNGHFKQVGNGQPQPYVHPSEQVVPEPKKYMGSNIPSRSFKILQAMTAPSDSSANANYNEEIPFNPAYHPYNYPYYPPPYWPEYYPTFYPQESSDSSKSCDKISAKSGRSTPIPHQAPYMSPYWSDYYAGFYPQEQSDSSSKLSDRSSRSGRSTPLPPAPPPQAVPPYWLPSYMSQKVPTSGFIRSQSTPPRPDKIRRPQTPKPYTEKQSSIEDPVQYPPYPMYPAYYDPYFYSYYYGYPPMMPAYHYYPPTGENEELSGYSSMDEMSNYNSRRSSLKQRRNSLENSANSVQSLRQHFEVRSKSAAPRITITPTFSQEKLNIILPPDKNEESEESEMEIEVEADKRNEELCNLKSIKSVPNINVYAQDEYLESDSESEESSDEETDEEEEEIVEARTGDDVIPHQLSIIYEESERGDSRWSYRPSSVASEATTIAEHKTEDEEEIEDYLSSQNVKFKINLFQESREKLSVNSSTGKAIQYAKETESFANLSFNTTSIASKCISPFLMENHQLSVEELKEDDKICSNTFELKEKSKVVDSYKGSKPNIEDFNNDEHENEFVIAYTEDEINKNDRTELGCNENDKQSDEDWWGIIENDETSEAKESSIYGNEECDNNNLKAEHVMNDVENEVVCVKLRKKDDIKKHSKIENTDESKNSKSGTLLFDNSFFDNLPTSNRNSIYDILKEDEESEEIVSGGTLMRVDSFASRLEEIKRSSGLWHLQNVETKTSIQTITEEHNETYDISNDIGVADSDNDELLQNHVTETNEDITEQSNELEEIHNNNNDEESDEVDFWSQIKNDDDDFKPHKKKYFVTENDEQDENAENKKADSAGSRHSSFSKSHANDESREINVANEEIHYVNNINYTQSNRDHDSDDTSDSESSEDAAKQLEMDRNNRSSNSRSRSLEPQTIKERIEALRQSITQKQQKMQEKEEISYSVKTKISAIEAPAESRSKTASTKSSVKSFEEYSEEEEVDSGVISDISRHISDNEEFPELRKLTRYERAATHSRLFKLLQDECDSEEAEDEEEKKKEDKFNRLSVRQKKGENKLSPSRSKLSLPLTKCNENDEDSPPVNEKLVNELIQSLLRSKKAQIFRNMPKEKLHDAAVRILQEGIDSSGDTPSEEFSSLLSPLRGGTESSTPAQTPQEFYGDYNEYKQYYDSWSEASPDIVPSKAFKLLQDHLGSSKLGTIEGILAKCPRILSSKNVPKEILKLLDESCVESFCTSSQNTPQSNDVTNT